MTHKEKNEFGHHGIITPSMCIDSWGAGPFLMEAGGKTIRFEDSDRFGPLFVGTTGKELANQFLAEHSPFWRQHRIWVRQGRRVAADGMTCLWDEPKPMRFRRINRKTALVVEAGEEDGREIEES